MKEVVVVRPRDGQRWYGLIEIFVSKQRSDSAKLQRYAKIYVPDDTRIGQSRSDITCLYNDAWPHGLDAHMALDYARKKRWGLEVVAEYQHAEMEYEPIAKGRFDAYRTAVRDDG